MTLAVFVHGNPETAAIWGRCSPSWTARRPGLAVVAEQDTVVGTEEQRRAAAALAGAQVVRLEGLGHWWMLQDPKCGAELLADFWTSS